MQALAESILFLGIIVLLPALIVLGLSLSMWAVLLSPFVLIGIGLFMLIKDRLPHVPPPDAKPAKPKVPRKPIMVTWDGRSVPLGVVIGSTIVTILSTILVLIAILLWIPWWASGIVLVFCIGMYCGGTGKR